MRGIEKPFNSTFYSLISRFSFHRVKTIQERALNFFISLENMFSSFDNAKFQLPKMFEEILIK